MNSDGSSDSCRILVLANHIRGPSHAGGARTWHQVRTLGREFHVDLIVPSVDPLTKEVVSGRDLPLGAKGTIRFAPCMKGDRKSWFGRMVYQASSASGTLLAALRSKKPDIVVAMGAPPSSAFVGFVTAKFRRVPLLLDVRDIPLETAEELDLLRPRWLLRVGKWLEGVVFKRSDRLLCVSEEMGGFVSEKGVSSETIRVNYIGYDDFEETTGRTPVASSRVALVNGLHPDTKVVVFYAGTLATLVDVPTVMRAAQRLKGDSRVGFVIVGEGEKREKYVKWGRSEGLNVTFPGRLPKAKVHELAAAADVCVYPLRGGRATGAMLGNKIFDYLGAGKPVIYTGPEGAVSRLIQDLGAGVTLPQEDGEGLARVLKELVEEPLRFAEMGQLARERVLEGLTAAHSAEKLVQELKCLINPESHRGDMNEP